MKLGHQAFLLQLQPRTYTVPERKSSRLLPLEIKIPMDHRIEKLLQIHFVLWALVHEGVWYYQ